MMIVDDIKEEGNKMNGIVSTHDLCNSKRRTSHLKMGSEMDEETPKERGWGQWWRKRSSNLSVTIATYHVTWR